MVNQLNLNNFSLLTIDKGGKEDRGAITAENQDTPRRLAGKYMANQQIGNHLIVRMIEKVEGILSQMKIIQHPLN